MTDSRTMPPELQAHIDALTDSQWSALIVRLSHWLPDYELEPEREPHIRPDVRGLGQRHIREETEP